MKVVVYPHRLEIGGNQLNAIELAGVRARPRPRGDRVSGQPGGLVRARASNMGLEFVAAPQPRGRPSAQGDAGAASARLRARRRRRPRLRVDSGARGVLSARGRATACPPSPP